MERAMKEKIRKHQNSRKKVDRTKKEKARRK
jgi:hypothetical protein